MDFQNNIKNWVSLDNKIKNLQKETKQLREEKGQLVDKILTYVETNNLEEAVIEISDGKLQFQNYKVTQPLTFKFMEKCLLECIQNEEQVKQLVKYIKTKREVRFNTDIKRTQIKK